MTIPCLQINDTIDEILDSEGDRLNRQNSPRFQIHTLGCKVNQYDSERIRSQLLRNGLQDAGADAAPDLIVVNTCSVTAESDRKGRQLIRRMARLYPQARLAVTGCYSQRKPDEIAGIAGVCDVIPIEQQEQWVREIAEEMGWGCADQDALWGPNQGIEHFHEHTRAFIKIQDGCDLKCTFCSIPNSRGVARSRPLQEVVEEARGLVALGYGEIVLCGICVGHYGRGLGYGLPELVGEMAQLQGIQRIRISSLEPQDASDELLAVMAEHPAVVCPHLHLPLQAGSDKILRRMKRPYTAAFFQERVERARQLMPHFEISTDIMVGFPDETEEDFEATLEAVRVNRFNRVHSFPFSVREEAPARRMKNQLPMNVIKERRKQLDALALEVANSVKASYIGQRLPVLCESGSDEHVAGYTPNYLRVEVHADRTIQPGEEVAVQLNALENGRLVGVACEEPAGVITDLAKA